MRLLHARSHELKSFHKEPPPYAILSHRWTEHELSLQDVERGLASTKINAFTSYIAAQLQLALDWVWIDSCCIDQKAAAELSEAVNCMFDWYLKADLCVAYLADVKDLDDFASSVWFKRGWTLQELVASTVVVFVNRSWEVMGHKGRPDQLHADFDAGPNLEARISNITGIDVDILRDFNNSHALTIEQKLRWMEGRDTLREEDWYYALFGIFDIAPGANYGEKKTGAEQRFRDAIARKHGINDCTARTERPRHHLTFARDPCYVERKEMASLKEKLGNGGARVTLVGLGGVGKSQLAIEYCYRTLDNNPSTWIFWLHASSATRFDQEISTLLEHLDIPGRQDQNVNPYQLLRRWLTDAKRQWLIVLDNADDADFLFESPEVVGQGCNHTARFDYFPTCSHGSLLITSRRANIARRMVDHNAIIFLRPDRELAIELFRTKLDTLEESPEVQELAAALDHIPLAVAQAIAYILQRRPRCSVASYLEMLKRSKRSEAKILSKSEPCMQRRDRLEAQNSILLTWQISFEHLYTMRKSAADLLSIMSFYDHQGIPDFLVKSAVTTADAAESVSDKNSDLDEDDAFEQDIAALRDFSFISLSVDGGTLQMHRLVQLSAQIWLQDKTQLFDQFQIKSLQNLRDALPKDTFEHRAKFQTLQPHAKRFINMEVTEPALPLLSWVMFRAAEFANTRGLYWEAETMMSRSVQTLKTIRGETHSDTLVTVGELASTYRNQGEYRKAANLHAEVLEKQIRALGEEHDYTLSTMNNLALDHQYLGDYKTAGEVQAKLVELRTVKLGADHASTLQSLSNLGQTYGSLERYAEAETLDARVLEARRRTLGQEHPSTLTSISNLASTYRAQGRFTEAANLALQALLLSEKVLGERHPDTMTRMNNLAKVSRSLGRYAEAESLQLKELDITASTLGEDHPLTLISKSNLASLYRDRGDYVAAERLGAVVLQTRQRVLGEEHPDTLTSMSNLSLTFNDLGQYTKAEELQSKALTLYRKTYGEKSPSTLTCMELLALTYKDQGRFEEAHELQSLVVQLLEKEQSVREGPQLLAGWNNLASIYTSLGRSQEAEMLHHKVLRSMNSNDNSGKTHPLRLAAMVSMAKIYLERERWDDAEVLLLDIVEHRSSEEVLGIQHPSTLTAMHNLARVLFHQDRILEAYEMGERCCEARARVLGEHHSSTLESKQLLKTIKGRIPSDMGQSTHPKIIESDKSATIESGEHQQKHDMKCIKQEQIG